MDLKWRFSSGILFSFTFHALLISLLFQAYPDIKNRSVWFWKELPLIPNEKKPASVLSFGNVKKHLDILSADKIIFPDLVRIRIPIKNQGIYISNSRLDELYKTCDCYEQNNILNKKQHLSGQYGQDKNDNMEKNECLVIIYQHHIKNLFTYLDTQDGCLMKEEEKHGMKL